MAIDRIGGKGPTVPTTGADAPAHANATFEVARPDATSVAQHAQAVDVSTAKGPLERLRAGEIDASAYVDLKVDEATRHMTQLRPEDLAVIKAELRHRMLADPALADLVQSATGTKLPLESE